MAESSTSNDTAILVLVVFLALFFFVLFKYVPQIVTYPWAAFMFAEMTYVKHVLEYLPQLPYNNGLEAGLFILVGVTLKVFIFTQQFANSVKKKIKAKFVAKMVEGNFLYFTYCAFIASTAVLVFYNTDDYYYDIVAVWERLKDGSWKTLKYSNVFKVDFYMLPFNASVVIPSLFYMASKFRIMPKNKVRHDLESLIFNLSSYFGFNRWLISRNPIRDADVINPQAGHHGNSYKANTYLKENGALCDVLDKSGEVYCSFIDSRRLYTIFSYQAGPAFSSFEDMEERHRWLALCLALIVIGKRDRADSINYKIGYYYNNREKPPEKGGNKFYHLIRNIKFALYPDYGRVEINKLVNAAVVEMNKNKLVISICKQHGFVYSLIWRLQKEAGSKGKTPPNHYYWIYFEDRILGMVVCEQGKPGFSIEAYAPNTIAENEYASKKPMRMPDIADVVKQLERYLIEEYPVFLYQDENTARIVLEQESFKLRQEGQLPEFGYWSLRYIKAPSELPSWVSKSKLKYPKNWTEEMKRHALTASFLAVEKAQ